MGKIIAIGGGEIGRPKDNGYGFYPVETTAIDKEILLLTNKRSPTLLFLPTASYDSVSYYEVVKKHFMKIGFSAVDALYLSDKNLTKAQIRNSILSHDAIDVGGGDTSHMMVVWKNLGLDMVLNEALASNIVLSGLSAGSICWFNSGISDSSKLKGSGEKFVEVSGLGYIDALHCPHYDLELLKQTDLKRILKTTSKVAIALDNCSALEVVDNKYRVITSRRTAKARKIYWQRNEYITEEVTAETTYKDLQQLLKK